MTETMESKVLVTERVEEYVQQLRLLVALVRAADASPVLVTEPGRDSKETKGVDIYWNPACKAYNEWVRHVAKTEQVLLLDFEGRVKDSALFFFDLMHYNDRGLTLMAELVAVGLEQLVEESASSRAHH